jgi:hypothetical protein
MRISSKSFVLVSLFGIVSSVLIAQDASADREEEPTPQLQTLPSSSVEFSRPKVIADLTAKPTIAGRFDCGEDGSIYTFIDGYAPNSTGTTPKERLALLEFIRTEVSRIFHGGWRQRTGIFLYRNRFMSVTAVSMY